MPKNKAYIIGVGPGSADYVHPEARKRIEEAGIIVGWEIDIAPVKELTRGKNILILDDVEQMPRQTAEYLVSQGISEDTEVIVCENLSLEDERLFKGTLKDVVDMDFSWQSVMVVKK